MSSSDSSFSVIACQRSEPDGSPKAEVCEGRKLTLLLGLLLGLLGSATSSSSTASRGGSSGTATSADGREKVLHVLALKSLQCNNVPVSQFVRRPDPGVRS
jgi:hypothetical protein